MRGELEQSSELLTKKKFTRVRHRDARGDHGGGVCEGGSGGPGQPHHFHLRPQDPAMQGDGHQGRGGQSR